MMPDMPVIPVLGKRIMRTFLILWLGWFKLLRTRPFIIKKKKKKKKRKKERKKEEKKRKKDGVCMLGG